ARLRWIEHWGCQVYQFSFRSFMMGFAGKSLTELRREFGGRFAHHFRSVENGAGLLESKEFLGRSEAEERQFQGTVAYVEKSPNDFLTPPDKSAPKQAAFDDLNPPPTFLVSLDAAADGITTNGKDFFGVGGVDHPDGLDRELDGYPNKT